MSKQYQVDPVPFSELINVQGWALNWLLRQKAITTLMRKSLDKQYRDTCICQWKLHSYLYLSMKKYIGNIVCLSNNINR